MFFLVKCLFFALLSFTDLCASEEQGIVLATKRLIFEEFPDAYNPSIVPFQEGYLLCFRHVPNHHVHPWVSHTGIVILDKTFTPISKPQLLKMRPKQSKTPSQAEDARLFTYKGRVFLIYNDNIEVTHPTLSDRRDMFVAELFYQNGFFTISAARKLIHEAEYQSRIWQKNWVPFEWNGMLLLTYSVNPHEILYPNFVSGNCYPYHKTELDLAWKWGGLRCSVPPLLDEGEYLSFFHSASFTSSPASWGYDMWHYFMGAYTFSKDPPFHITKMSASPIIGDNFYTPSSFYKRVVFPGGCVISDSYIYVAYGKDDREIWIATLDKAALKRSLIPVQPKDLFRN